MPGDSDHGDPTPTAADVPTRLAPRGRAIRLVVTVLCFGLLLAGTLVGQDDDFPFGPFRMYATTDHINDPVRDTRVDAVDNSGHRFELTEVNSGFRRAEVEGQIERLTARPELLGAIADGYARKNPSAGTILHVAVVVRWHELHDGRPTGRYRDSTVVTWDAPGAGAGR